jgi:hypothetical protein
VAFGRQTFDVDTRVTLISVATGFALLGSIRRIEKLSTALKGEG